MIPTLTPRERQLVVAIDTFINEHGYSPSMEELADRCGLLQRSTIFTYIRKLAGRGVLTNATRIPRSVRLAPGVTVSDGEVYLALEQHGHEFGERANG